LVDEEIVSDKEESTPIDLELKRLEYQEREEPAENKGVRTERT